MEKGITGEVRIDSSGTTFGSRNDSSRAINKDFSLEALRGGAWLFIGKFYRQTVFVIRATVLARLLSPHDFGLVGMGELAILFLGSLTYTGFDEALVQRRNLSPEDIHTAWWVSLGRLAFIGLVLWFGAPWIARYIHEPAATPVLRAWAAMNFFSGFASIGIVLLYKNLQFQQVLKIESLSLSAELCVSIAAAFYWRNVWAIVFGVLAGVVAKIFLSYIFHPYRPRILFNLKAARELFHYGKWLTVASLLSLFMSKGTDTVSGFLFGASGLGLYQMASRFALLPSNHIGETLLQIMFPAYSAIQEDPQRMKIAFLKVIQMTTFIVFPLSALMAVTVAPALPWILGIKWQAVLHLMPALAIGGAIQSLLRAGAPLFMAIGQPNKFVGVNITSSLGIILFLYPLSSAFGLEGLAWAYAAGISIGLPIWWFLIKMQARASHRDLLVSIGPALLASVLLALAVNLPVKIFQLHIHNWQSSIWLLFLTIFGIILYFIAIFLMELCLVEFKPMKNTLSLINRSKLNQVISGRLSVIKG